MKTYSRIKKISKYMILFTAFLLVFSSLFFIPELNLKIEAEAAPDPNLLISPTSDYAIRIEAGLPKYVYVESLENDEIDSAYTDPGTALKFVRNDDCQNLGSNALSCWQFDANFNWPYPSISEPYTLDYNLIFEISGRVNSIENESDEVTAIKRRLTESIGTIEDKYTEAAIAFQDAEVGSPTVAFETQLNSPRVLYMTNPKSEGVISPNQQADETLVKQDTKCSDYRLSGTCYSMKVNDEWPNPLVSSPFTPDWSMINEAYYKITARFTYGNEVNFITAIRERYLDAAASNPNLTKIYYISGDDSNFTIYAKSLSDYAEGVESTNENEKCDPLKVEKCWYMGTDVDWQDKPPSIESDETIQADFAFLTEVLQNAKSVNDVKSLPQIEKLMKKYVGEAFANWDDVKFDISNTKGQVTIRSQEFFDVINEETPNLDKSAEKYIFFNKAPDRRDQIMVLFNDSYPEAKEDSLWYRSVMFLLGSVIPAWQEVGVDLSEYKTACEINLERYLAISSRETATTGSLTTVYPKDIIVGQEAYTGEEFVFNTTINKSLFPAPASGYQTKVYLKPEIKGNENVFIKLPNNALAFTTDTISFNWKEIKSSFYTESDGTTVHELKPEDVSSYDFNFPQKYKMSIITYNADNSIKDRQDITFQTVNNDAVTGRPINENSNPYFSITGPGFIRKGGNADFTITVKNTNMSASKPEVKKVVIYFCTGSGTEADASDGVSCQITQSGRRVDAIKVAYATKEILDANPGKGWKLLEFKDNITTIKYTLDTTNSIVGMHALRVKGYKNAALTEADDGYIDGTSSSNNDDALIAEDLVITTGDAPAGTVKSATSKSTPYGNLLKFSLNSVGEKGSSLTTLQSIINRIITLVLSFIGLLAFFVILIAGFMYMTAGGNAEQATKAKNAILYALLGIALTVLSYGIMRNVIRILNSITGGTGGGSSTIGYTFKNILPANPTEIDLSHVMIFFQTVMRFALDLVGIVGFIMILYASVLYVLSVGDENKATTAKKTLIWSVAGTAFVTFAALIIDFISKSLA